MSPGRMVHYVPGFGPLTAAKWMGTTKLARSGHSSFALNNVAAAGL